jgi:hypothetical protein
MALISSRNFEQYNIIPSDLNFSKKILCLRCGNIGTVGDHFFLSSCYNLIKVSSPTIAKLSNVTRKFKRNIAKITKILLNHENKRRND